MGSRGNGTGNGVRVCLATQLYPTLCDPVGYIPQAPLSMGFPRQEYRSDFPFPPPRDLPNLGITPRSPALQADSLLTEPPVKPGEDMWTFTSHFPEEKSTLREGNPFAEVHEKV